MARKQKQPKEVIESISGIDLNGKTVILRQVFFKMTAKSVSSVATTLLALPSNWKGKV